MDLDGVSLAALEEFWRRCGPPPSFPRDLERALALGLPIFTVKMPRLRLGAMREWFSARGRTVSALGEPDRLLRGGLIVSAGTGVIFLDGGDPVEEQRFSLAHEVAHFLLDYWLPCRAALEKLGPGFVEVLDGRRAPTTQERLGAVLLRAPLQTYVNLLARGRGSLPPAGELDEIEARADRLALVLLAPEEAVLARVGPLDGGPYEDRLRLVTSVLEDDFGLPRTPACLHAGSLLAGIGKGRSWAERLRR